MWVSCSYRKTLPERSSASPKWNGPTLAKAGKPQSGLPGTTFTVSPHEIYEALMDSEKHSKFTGAPATISREVGGEFTAHDGYIKGKTIELVPDRKIVQEWRASSEEWPNNYFSTAIFLLEDSELGGTHLKFTQAGVPEDAYESIKQGWNEHYWVKIKEMLEG